MSKLSDLLQSEMDLTKTHLIGQYDKLGLRASGSYAKSLETYAEDKGENIRAGILGAHYVLYMEEGRRPNKRQDRGMIAFIYVKLLEWMKVKGVTDINPWMAARKIVREGIKVPNRFNKGGVISGVINEEWMEDLNEKIFDLQNETFMDAIVSDLQSIAT